MITHGVLAATEFAMTLPTALTSQMKFLAVCIIFEPTRGFRPGPT